MAQADGLRDRCRLRAKRTPESLPQVRNRARRGQQNPPASPFLPTSPATQMQPSASSVATAAARAGCERAWYRCARGAGRTPEIGPRARGRIPARTRRARVMNPSAQARRRHCFRPPLPGGVRGRAGRTRARAGSVPRPPTPRPHRGANALPAVRTGRGGSTRDPRARARARARCRRRGWLLAVDERASWRTRVVVRHRNRAPRSWTRVDRARVELRPAQVGEWVARARPRQIA